MRAVFQPCVYMMTNASHRSLYAGVTSNLPQRAWQHKEGQIKGYTSTYQCKKLVWYELHSTMEHAISREKQLKGGSRAKKLALIESFNPG